MTEFHLEDKKEVLLSRYPNVLLTFKENGTYSPELITSIGEALNKEAQSLKQDEVGSGPAMSWVRDVWVHESDGTIEVRTEKNDSISPKGERALRALFFGVLDVTTRWLAGRGDMTQADITAKAQSLLQSITRNPELSEAFYEYFGGLMWHSDEERFIRQLFRVGSKFDPAFLNSYLEPYYVDSLLYKLGISYEQIGRISDMPLETIFAKFPYLDYRRLLSDKEFEQSEEGEKLKGVYAKAIGQIKGDQFTRSFGWGTRRSLYTDPMIPLAQFPVIEALIVNQAKHVSPEPKYSFGPNDPTNFIVHSDSEYAHRMLVEAMITRLPKERRRVFDGPDEFDVRSRQVDTILRAYKDTTNPEKRGLLANDLIALLKGFTDGEVAKSVGSEYVLDALAARKEGHKYIGLVATTYGKLRGIIKDLLAVSIVAPDENVRLKAGEVVLEALRKHDLADLMDLLVMTSAPVLSCVVNPEGYSVYAMSKEEIEVVLIDALAFVGANTDLALLQRVGKEIFRNRSVLRKYMKLAELKIQIEKERHNPKVVRAREKMAQLDRGLDSRESKEYLEAVSNYERMTVYLRSLETKYRQGLNDFLIGEIEALAREQQQNAELEGVKQTLLKQLIKRTKIGNYYIRELPPEYYRLISVAESLTPGQRGIVAWHIAEQFQYVDDKAMPNMFPVIEDLYRLAMGEPDGIVLNAHSSHILGAASHLIYKWGRRLFEHASREQLQRLENYVQAVQHIINELAEGNNVSRHFAPVVESEVTVLKDIARNFATIREKYEAFLYILRVEAEPEVFYKWAIDKLTPFLNKMAWEVGPGNRPSRDILKLWQTLKRYVNDEFVSLADIREGNFDPIQQGNFGSFIYDLYSQMILNRRIQYNRTVWGDGISYLYTVIGHMPEQSFDQLLALYQASDHHFVNWLKQVRKTTKGE